MNRSDLKRYQKELNRALLCPNSCKKELLQSLSADMDAYLAENPDTTIEELRAVFGKPGAYARSYLAEMDDDTLYRTVFSSIHRNRALICSLLAASLAFGSFCAIFTARSSSQASSYYSIRTTVR